MKPSTSFYELLALTELYLFQKYSIQDWKLCETESYEYLRNYALSLQPQKRKPPPPPIKKEEPSVADEPSQPRKSVIFHPVPPQKKQEPIPTQDSCQQFQKLFPNIALLDTPPDDSCARALAWQWKKKKECCDVLILSDRTHPEHHAFLIKIAIALKNRGKQVEVIETSDLSHLSLFSPSVVLAHHHLLSKNPSLATQFEKTSQMIIIENLTETIKDPQKKRELWNQLRDCLQIP